MNFARRVFFWSGVYGIVVLVPMFFLEESIGRHIPPATNRPEQYYGFIGVALPWQFAFFLITHDPFRYRPLMLAAVAARQPHSWRFLLSLLQQTTADMFQIGPDSAAIDEGRAFQNVPTTNHF